MPKYLIVSLQDSETGANNYEDLEIKRFKSDQQAIYYMNENCKKEDKLYKLEEIKFQLRKALDIKSAL